MQAVVSRRRNNALSALRATDKFDSSTFALDCSDEEFRSVEASLYQVIVQNDRKRTSENSCKHTKGQKGFEAWHAIVRRYDQRSMTDTNSAYAALISNISERGRAKDVEQVDDTLRTFINETNKFENRFGLVRDQDKMLAVKKLTLGDC